MSNLKLWDSVSKTDPDYTKKVNQRGGYTAISPQYQLKLATEKFGPYGAGFGLELSELDYSLFADNGVVLHKAVFFYNDSSGKQSFIIHNAIQAKTQNRFDVDFAKKLETNTVSKALSKLGFNADIFMGEFDDNDYFAERVEQTRIDKAANKDEEKAKIAAEYQSEVEKVVEQINNSKIINEVEGLYKALFRKINKPEYKSLLMALTKAKDEAKERLDG